MLSCSDGLLIGGLGRSRLSTADRAADTAVDRAVDHGPRVHREPTKWVRPELIYAVHWQSGGPGDPQAMRGGAEAGDGWRTATLHQKLAGEGVLELRCTIHDAVWTGRKRRMARSSPGGRGRRWDTGVDMRQRGAVGRPGTRRGGGCGLGCVLLGVAVGSWWSCECNGRKRRVRAGRTAAGDGGGRALHLGGGGDSSTARALERRGALRGEKGEAGALARLI
jgi:hypothetical protein